MRGRPRCRSRPPPWTGLLMEYPFGWIHVDLNLPPGRSYQHPFAEPGRRGRPARRSAGGPASSKKERIIMSSFKRAFILTLAGLAFAGAAAGEICALDGRPGATLLLPYFEASLALDPATGTRPHDTLVVLSNASRQGVIAQVVLWSEFGAAIYGFPVYLGGYDQQSFTLSEVVTTGTYPATRLSSLARRRFPTCPAVLSGATGRHMPLLALPNQIGGLLAGTLTLGGSFRVARSRPGADFARGYLTVDVVRDCTQGYPGSLGYFVANGQGVATNDNVLWGSYTYVDNTQDTPLTHTGRLVSLEASGADPRTSASGSYTFYKRFVGTTAADNREPLGTNHAVHYFSGLADTEIIYWRDPLSVQAGTTAALPPWAPLGQVQATLFDEEQTACVLPAVGIEPFPVNAGKTALLPQGITFETTALDSLDLCKLFGWVHLNLNHPNVGAAPIVSQSWVGVLYRRADGQAGMMDGMELDSACAPNTDELRVPALPLVTGSPVRP